MTRDDWPTEQSSGPAPSVWSRQQLDSADASRIDTLPPIHADRFSRISDTLDIWDAWPVQEEYGAPLEFADGSTLWMALGSPVFTNPDDRHAHARLHLLRRARNGSYAHQGLVLPDGFSPGSREWSGSAVLDAHARHLTLYFTATGVRGEQEATFVQRLFRAEATLEHGDGSPRLTDWRGLREIILRDPQWYMASDAGGGAVGTIKAFRDPAYFRDPVGGGRYITFAASSAGSSSDYNGVVGFATGDEQGQWTIQPPIVSADGLNNELERPHLLYYDGLYYLFWSTQRQVFDPATPGPTGLYGMVSSTLDGNWEPLNGSGIVFTTPEAAPAQSYSWLVLPDLRVISFVDNWGQADLSAPRRFGATFAPEVELILDGSTARLRR